MTYMLSEGAARKLRDLLRDPSALVPTNIGQTRKVRPDAGGGGRGGGGKFHFDIQVGQKDKDGKTPVTVGEGLVQIGGYTYAAPEQTVHAEDGEAILCVRVALPGGSCSCEWFASLDELNQAQDDMGYYIFPLAKFSEGRKVLDCRPLPQAGIWEDRVKGDEE